MSRPLRIEFEGAFYHVTSRGNERKRIFFTPRDYEKFKEYVAEAERKYQFILHCYVLMTNHYHMLIETPHKNLHKIMQYLNSSYSTYVNTKRQRCGHLFQGRYKAIIIDKNSYFVELSRYMHLNPVRAKMVEKPEDYAYSSYSEFIKGGNDPILSKAFLLRTFTEEATRAREMYRSFVEDGLKEDLENPLTKAYGGFILGDEDFVTEVLENIGGDELESEDIAQRRVLSSTMHVENILAMLAEHFDVPLEVMVEKGSNRRKICVYMLKKYSDASNKRISEVLGGRTYSSAAKIYQRFIKELENDAELKREVEVLEQTLPFVQA